MVASSLVYLPRDILSFIANYFLEDDDQNKNIHVFRYDWRNFMNSSKEIFGLWKKESQIIVLTFPYSETFYNSEEFRGRILHSIETPRLQLDLIFNRFSSDPDNPKKGKTVEIDLKRIIHTRKISMNGGGFPVSCQVIPFLNLDVDEISFRGIKVNDFSFLSNVKNVSFSADGSMPGTKLDLAPFQHIKKGIIRVDQCVNDHLLANLQSLEISNCSSITDMSCFANIPVLNLNGCINITDVSPLSRCHNLDFSFCDGITEVSSLKNVHRLVLDSCDNVTDVSGLENVYSLSIRIFQGESVSGLKNVVILDIAHSENVSNISMLHSVRDLNITDCPKIKELTGLVNLKELTIDNVNKITSGSDVIQQLVKLVMAIDLDGDNDHWTIPKEKKPWEDFDMLIAQPNMRHLVVNGFNSLIEFPFMSNLCSLELWKCNKLINLTLPSLPWIRSLEIWDCNHLVFVHLLGDSTLKFSLEIFNLHSNHQITKVQIDRKVSRCRIDHCTKLAIIELRQQVGNLHCPLEPCLERIVNQSWVVTLSIQISVALRRKSVLNRETDELIFTEDD
jgi:hypothetical protein